MALETRNSAIYKRAEQLRRWEDSDTNRERIQRKTKSPRVKFSASCVFLAACRAGDKDEVLKLLEKGTDINTANVDGLTALHQASIEDNLDMVEFLVQNGANVNLGDNEGWTPLHATASCGFCSIAKYLIEHGADVAAINNERELPIDLAESDDMSDILREEIQKREIDCETARGNEERCMIEDAKQWASGDCNENIDVPDHKTGATILHIAAAKGYIEVMQILLDNGLVDVDKQDYDGWTPLHAAAHWGQREAARLLVDNLADMEIENFYRQTPFDVADPDMLEFLENLKVKQSSLNKEIILGKRQAKQKFNAPAKIKKVDLKIENDKGVNEDENGTMDNNIEKKNRVNAGVTPPSPTEPSRIFPPSPVSPPSPTTTTANEQNSISRTANQAPTITPKAPPTTDSNQDESGTIPSWRRPASFRTRLGNDSPTKSLALRIGEKETKSPTSPTSRLETDVVLRRTHSFENDENKDPSITSSSPVTTPTVTISTANTSPNRTSSSPTATSPQPNNQMRRSFVPPVRDEESETQRKAHAKRVRETRRSTQGVTLDEIKSAEQIIKQKNQPNSIDQFKLEDAGTNTTGTPTVFARRTGSTQSLNVRPSSAPVESTTNVPPSPPVDAVITLPLRRNSKPLEDKDQDKENDVRNAQATQAVIQRRKRPKRRSTGVVHVDMDEIDPDNKQDSNAGGDCDDAKLNHQESGSEQGSGTRRLVENNSTPLIRDENGEIDYKKLWEQSQAENERLRDKLRKQDDELRDTKTTLEKISTVTSKNSLSELEKREKRAMERKLSEMEEELKQLEALKVENQRLKDENGALIRVISKLSK